MASSGYKVYEHTRESTDGFRAWYDAELPLPDLTSFSSSSAAGGFVIYPNKPNNNQMNQVYAK